MSSVIAIPVTLESTVPQGVAPFTVTSTTLCTNLNAQFLNGKAEAFYRNATNLDAGTVALARFPTSSTANRYLKVGTANTTPAYSPLNGGDITEGTVAPARLGSGTPSTSTFLRGDGQWVAPTAVISSYKETFGNDSNHEYTFTHNLGTLDVVVQYHFLSGAFSNSYTSRQVLPPNMGTTEVIDEDTVKVTFASPPGIDKIRVIIIPT